MTIIACNITKLLNVYIAFPNFDVYKFTLKCTYLFKMVCTTLFFKVTCYIGSVALYILTRIQEEYPEYEFFDIINLAEKMGYFANKETIFDFLSRSGAELLIDGSKVEVNMPLDWVDSLEDKATKRHQGFSISDIDKIIVWDTFVSGDPHNIYFTFGELIDAEYSEEQDFWMVEAGGDMLTIQTKQKV